MNKKTAIIVGAGPAGLTAAYELLKRTDIKPIVLEKSGDIGGISKTVNYKGNRIDIGGHRFFSKSDRVMNWWFHIMPVQTDGVNTFNISYQNKSRGIDTGSIEATYNEAEDTNKVMLVRKRLSRIYFLRKFFTYPIQLSLDTLTKLGLWTTIAIMFSYLNAQLFRRRPEKNLEDFMINRFGRVLYKLFFKDYTEKVWGIPCNVISAEWGAQRIKGVSISKAIQHAVQSVMKKKQKAEANDISQKDTETSLIEQFLYPKFGPGQLWEEVARQVEKMGGKILMHHDVKRIYTSDEGNGVSAIAAINNITGETSYLEGDYFFSTMPVQDFIGGLDGPIPDDVKEVAAGLQYRDFITVGILLKKLSFQDKKTGEWKPLDLKDTWIYIQEKDVKVGRLQLFNNWSPYMVKDPDTVWVGMEFFCNTTDEFWNMIDEDIKQLAISELEKIGLASKANVLDVTVLRMEKTYPAYFGTYERFDVVRSYVDRFENLFLVGRNGMHKYNNSDHSMLTAMVSVDNIVAGVTSKANIWAINTEQEYHEEKNEAARSGGESMPESIVERHQTINKELEIESTFKRFLFHNRLNRRLLLFATFACIIQFAIFKYLFPFASYIHGDSFVYIQAAAENADINTHLIGYSRFLRLFSVFSSSDTVLVTFQYLFAQTSGLFFLFTLFFFHSIGRTARFILVGIMVINPMFLYMANLVSSDCLFLGLSLTWFALLLWLIHRPSNRIIFWHAVVLSVAFTIRYNALVYPVIAALAFLLASIPWYKKIAGILLPVLLCGLFILYTGNQYKALTGTWQFSPFSGWQAANNAMYTYRYVDSADRKPVPEKFKVLDSMVRNHFDTDLKANTNWDEADKASTTYMWTPSLPLHVYANQVVTKRDTAASELKKWALMGPFFKEYGTHILKEYPLAFMKHFMWPNLIKYYAPPAEFLEFYNCGYDEVHSSAVSWFHYSSNKVYSHIRDPKAYPLEVYPILTGMMNGVLACCLLCYLWLAGWRNGRTFPKTIVLVASIWLLNAAFTIVSSPAAIRLQAFPILLETTFALVLIDWLWKFASQSGPAVNFKTELSDEAVTRPAQALA